MSGKVTLQGKPIAGVNVNFESKNGIGAFATADASGSFKLSDPLPVGQYSVYLTLPVPMPPAPGDPPPPPAPSEFPARYRMKENSGLSADVKAGANVVNFELEPGK